MFFGDRWRRYVEDEERAIIPKAVLKQIRVEDISDNFQIEVCESKDSSVIMVSVPMTFVKLGKNEFQVIYDELITRKYWVSKVIIAISGKFTQNAVEKIIEGVTEYPLKNNLIFLDKEKIEGLMSKIAGMVFNPNDEKNGHCSEGCVVTNNAGKKAKARGNAAGRKEIKTKMQ